MSAINKLSWAVITASVAPGVFASDFTDSSFVKDSTLSVLSRNYYFNRDFRGDGVSQSKRDEWAQGFIATFNSGFTPGTVGVGFDAIGMLGLKLDSSSDRINSGLLPASGNGTPGVDKAQDEYSKGAVAVKFKVSKSILKIGQQMVKNPVFNTNDSRLLPETAEGSSLTVKEIDNLTLDAGHFTSLRLKERTANNSGALRQIDYMGGVYKFTPGLSAALYASSVKDYWDKRYLGVNWVHQLDDLQSVKLDFAGYQQKSIGEALSGELDVKAYSLKGTYTYGNHSFALAEQQIHGTGKYMYGTDGGDTNYLANYIQYMDGTKENEKSWQARYDYDFAGLGIPGLALQAKYVKGTGAKVSATIDDAKEWERDLQVSYVIQSGPVKGLSFRVRQATYRNDFNSPLDEVRFITEYPLSL